MGNFIEKYEDIAHLISINVDEQLIQAMVRFWDPAYQCFTFNQEDMTSTIQEYSALLRFDNVQLSKIYVKEPKPMTFKKKLMKLTGMSDTWAEKLIKKNELSCVLLIIFPKVLGHIEVTVVDFFENLRQDINPAPTILAETFRSLSSCRKKGERCFIGCDFRVENITWKAPWIHHFVLYKYGNQDWVPLLGLWGGVAYAPLMVERQFTLRQFVPTTDGLAQSEFTFTGEGYMKKGSRYCKF
ncbi:hypothetical protein Goarm_020256, partial [Gossypium armourianum]|nr:hypothetical protein [Gossypium armourianum]